MKKYFGKIGALVLAGVMAMAMSVTAFAANATLSGGIAGTADDSATKQENTILILKELKVYNTTGGNIYLPTVGYTYTISGEEVAENITVTDSDEHSGYVYTGNTAALDATTKTVSFSSSTTAGYTAQGVTETITQPTTAAKEGTSYYGGFTVTVKPDTLGHAGIFRYKIVESEDRANTLAKAGVVHQNNDEYKDTRYLDVYVRRAVEADVVETNYVVYGYVLWTPAAGQSEDTSVTYISNVTKENGWVADKGGDEYNTYNLVVTKSITGTLAETTHQFPFQVVFTSPNATAATIHYTATNGDPSTQTAATLSSANTTTIGTLDKDSSLKLTNNGTVTFYGIPAGVTATVQEYNDTYDTYTAKAAVTAQTAQTYTNNQVQPGSSATIISDLDNATTTNVVGSADTTTAWTNEMTVISPTGLFLRFTPFLVIIGAAVLLLLVSRRRGTKKAAGRI